MIERFADDLQGTRKFLPILSPSQRQQPPGTSAPGNRSSGTGPRVLEFLEEDTVEIAASGEEQTSDRVRRDSVSGEPRERREPFKPRNLLFQNGSALGSGPDIDARLAASIYENQSTAVFQSSFLGNGLDLLG